MALKTLTGQHNIVRFGANRWRGTVGYSCPNDEIGQGVGPEALYGTTLAGYANDYAPVCVGVTTKRSGLSPGLALCVAHYETRRVPGKGTLLVRPRITHERREEDNLSRTIQGPDPGDYTTTPIIPGGQTVWKIVKGTNVIREVAATFILQTAHAEASQVIGPDSGMWNRINNNAMSNFLNAHEFTLRLAGAKVWSIGPGDLIYADYVFDYFRWGWNKTIKSQPQVVQVHQIPEFDPEGIATGVMRDVPVYVPAKIRNTYAGGAVGYQDEAAEYRPVYQETNFAPFNLWVQW